MTVWNTYGRKQIVFLGCRDEAVLRVQDDSVLIKLRKVCCVSDNSTHIHCLLILTFPNSFDCGLKASNILNQKILDNQNELIAEHNENHGAYLLGSMESRRFAFSY